MIAKLTGKIVHKQAGFIIVDVNGVGYKVHISPDALSKIGSKNEISIFTHLVVRENILDLYGFLKREELELFEILLTISGIGPKGALGILAQATVSEIRSSIAASDYSILTKVSGIGKKTAERIVLELKGKIGAFGEMPKGAKAMTSADQEAIEALMSLGYRADEARKAIKEVDAGVKDVGERVKLALKGLGAKHKA